MRTSAVCTIGLAALGAAQVTETIRYTITSTITSTSCVATETVTGTPPASTGGASYSVLSVITNPATPLSTSIGPPNATSFATSYTSNPAPSSSPASVPPVASSASSLMIGQGAVIAGVASMLCMFFVAL